MTPLALAACVAPYSTEYAVPARTLLDSGHIDTASTRPPPDLELGTTEECPYPLDRFWVLDGWDGPQYWLSFERLSLADSRMHGCLLWLAEVRTHRLRLVDPHWDGEGWVWLYGIRTRWVGDAVVVDGLPGSPWVGRLQEER